MRDEQPQALSRCHGPHVARPASSGVLTAGSALRCGAWGTSSRCASYSSTAIMLSSAPLLARGVRRAGAARCSPFRRSAGAGVGYAVWRGQCTQCQSAGRRHGSSGSATCDWRGGDPGEILQRMLEQSITPAGRQTRQATAPAPTGVIPAGLEVAEPEIAGPLAVFPLLAAPGEFEYWSFAEAASRGFSLTELEDASVNDLRAVNPLDVAVLLSDAEVVEGAQQDRVLDVPVLVGPGSQRNVPVCCVEPDRWDERRHAEVLTPSPYAVAPSLRAVKNRHVREALAHGRPARADQEEIWERVEGAVEAAEIESPTGAVRDIYAHHRVRLSQLESLVSRHDGQVGALVCLEGRPVVLDYVSRPEVWAALWRPLLRGYCLDALECGTDGPVVTGATADELSRHGRRDQTGPS